METKLISVQKEVSLPAFPKGFHLITNLVIKELPELKHVNVGTLHVYIKHTSASLSINEDADPSVRSDFEKFFQKLVPEREPYYTHTSEGPDDMPAHLKASLLGSSVTIPVNDGRLLMGTWQGIYLGEHRNHGGNRKIILTLLGSSS
ncbi:MAG: secondary thiamine-phosphate synthase enzyme YjbQ [Cyclobacteriaceae bacterium]|nr:secondary thiamine-phosphate synthase enzyme YjbQ [Cyclobacteriaceae bacterium]